MFCKFCGREIDENSVFCNKCGRNVVNNNSEKYDIGYNKFFGNTSLEKKMSKSEFITSNSVLNEKNNTAKAIQLVYYIISIFILIVIVFVIYNDYKDSIFNWYDDGFFDYIKYKLSDWIVPLILYMTIDITASVIVSIYRSKVMAEIDEEYKRYSFVYDGNSHNRNTQIPSSNGWKCPNCGKFHDSYVGSCGCGERKPVNSSQSQQSNISTFHNVVTVNNSWECPKCGNILSGSARICTSCGQSKPKDKY